MIEAKHTSGPWRIHGNFVVAGDHITICQWSAYTDENDARLIAAAPDMLAALHETKSSLNTLGTDGWSEAPHLLSIISAAIAKAEGRKP